jgi:hypothetical protein
MSLLIFTLLLAVIFIVLFWAAYKSLDNYDTIAPYMLSSSGAFIAFIWMCINISVLLTLEYSYDQWVIQRNAFEISLNEARQQENNIELASLTREVTEWNIQLARNKFANEHWYFGMYVSDRVKELQPIK